MEGGSVGTFQQNVTTKASLAIGRELYSGQGMYLLFHVQLGGKEIQQRWSIKVEAIAYQPGNTSKPLQFFWGRELPCPEFVIIVEIMLKVLDVLAMSQLSEDIIGKIYPLFDLLTEIEVDASGIVTDWRPDNLYFDPELLANNTTGTSTKVKLCPIVIDDICRVDAKDYVDYCNNTMTSTITKVLTQQSVTESDKESVYAHLLIGHHHNMNISFLLATSPLSAPPICPTYLPPQTVLGLCRTYKDHDWA
eukprot:10450997-Ditylum_brightwellii.AAC.1